MIPFMEAAFGAEAVGVHKSPQGMVLHATMRIGNATLEIGEAHGESQPKPCVLHVYVPDADAMYAQALEAGEARTGELDADELFALQLGVGDMDDAALRGKIGILSGKRSAVIFVNGSRGTISSRGTWPLGSVAARGVVRKRNADLQVRADGDVETSEKRGAAATKIFAGSFFFEDNASGIAPPNVHGKANGDSTFRALTREGRTDWDHGLGPRFW
jgi:hypothetical protein